MKRNIRTKLIIIFIVLVIIPIAALCSVSYIKINSVFSDELKESSVESVKAANSLFMKNYVNDIEKSITAWSGDTNVISISDNKKNSSYVMNGWEGYKKSNPNIVSIYYGTKDKKMFLIPKQYLPKGYDPTSRPWYTLAVTNPDKVCWTTPYRDVSNGDTVVTVAKAVKDSEDNILGVLGYDISLTKISDVSKNINLGEDGYALVLDSNNKVIGSPDTKLLGKNVSSNGWFTKLSASKESSILYKLNGKTFAISSVNVTQTNWKLIGFIPEDELVNHLKPIKETLIEILAIFILFEIICVIIVGLYTNRSMITPIRSIMNLMSKAAEGDLTVKSNFISEDEIGDLSKGFNNMIEGQRTIVQKLLDAASHIEKSSHTTNDISLHMSEEAQNQAFSMNELSKTMEDNSQTIVNISSDVNDISLNTEKIDISTREMGKAAEDISRNAADTANTLEVITKSIEGMNNSIDIIANNSKEANIQGENTVSTTIQGKTIIDDTMNAMDNINSAMDNLVSVIEDLGKSASRIGEIVEVVDDIAEQTNLLSLNASIEAARAGEHGRGFAVVASAIGKLAEKSSESTKDIEKLVKQIQLTVENAVNSTKSGAKHIEDGTHLIKCTGTAFDNIYEAIQKTTKLINEIAASTEEMAHESKEVFDAAAKATEICLSFSAASQQQAASVEEMINMTERTNLLTKNAAESILEQSANSEEVTATTLTLDEMARSILNESNEVSNLSQSMLSLSESLNSLVGKFRV